MEVSSAPAKRLEVREVLGETFSVYRDNVGALLGSAIVVFAVVGVASALARNTDSVGLGLLAIVVELAGHALYTGLVVRLVEDVRDGRRDHTVGDLFSAAAPAILPLVAFGILYAIGVGIGTVLLIVPGLILLTIWSLGPPAIVVERMGVIEAFGRSRRLVKGEAWTVFAILLLTLLIVIAVGVALGALAMPIGDGEVATVVAGAIASALTAPVFALAVSIMYFQLRGQEADDPAAPGEPPAATTA